MGRRARHRHGAQRGVMPYENVAAAAQLTAFAESLLDVLELFDTSIPPLGLYASDDLAPVIKNGTHYFEWSRALAPYLKEKGYAYTTFQSFLSSQTAWIEVPEIGRVHLQLAKTSKIKVRKYGSRYYIDKHVDFTERWQRLRVSKMIGALQHLSVDVGIALFIGFDSTVDPFGKEISQLQEELHWEKHEVTFLTRKWADRYERGFNVRLALWARSVGANARR